MNKSNLYFVAAISAAFILNSCSSQPEQKQEASTENEEAKIDAEIKPRLSAFAALPAVAENPENAVKLRTPEDTVCVLARL